ncbi:MAG: ParA family protein [Candidatus Omnitrophica bacterium]|nr:ParA family protein [Candidatus Omnitrophota bacterium]
MSQAIAICNQKGGVGKSTTAVNLGSYLALSGKKTLLFDLDPQGNATVSCGVNRAVSTITLYDVLLNQRSIQDAIAKSTLPDFDVVPSHPDLSLVDWKLANEPERERLLHKICEPVRSQYDVLLFDCPPSLGLLTVNALAAANSTLIPVQCEYLALEGLNSLLRSLETIRQSLNPSLKIGGIVLTMVDFRANLTREVAQEVRGFFKDLVFDASIPRNIRLAEAPSFGKPICMYDPTSSGAIAYDMLAKELTVKCGLDAQPMEAGSSNE